MSPDLGFKAGPVVDQHFPVAPRRQEREAGEDGDSDPALGMPRLVSLIQHKQGAGPQVWRLVFCVISRQAEEVITEGLQECVPVLHDVWVVDLI